MNFAVAANTTPVRNALSDTFLALAQSPSSLILLLSPSPSSSSCGRSTVSSTADVFPQRSWKQIEVRRQLVLLTPICRRHQDGISIWGKIPLGATRRTPTSLVGPKTRVSVPLVAASEYEINDWKPKGKIGCLGVIFSFDG